MVDGVVSQITCVDGHDEGAKGAESSGSSLAFTSVIIRSIIIIISESCYSCRTASKHNDSSLLKTEQ